MTAVRWMTIAMCGFTDRLSIRFVVYCPVRLFIVRSAFMIDDQQRGQKDSSAFLFPRNSTPKALRLHPISGCSLKVLSLDIRCHPFMRLHRYLIDCRMRKVEWKGDGLVS
jgi:hypothetical protein